MNNFILGGLWSVFENHDVVPSMIWEAILEYLNEKMVDEMSE